MAPAPYIVGLRYEADGFRMDNVPLQTPASDDRFADGITLTPSDPFIGALPVDLAFRLVRNNWAVRSALPREVDAFENGNIPPFDPTNFDVSTVRSKVQEIDDISRRELKALAELEENGSAREDVLDALLPSHGHPRSYYTLDWQ
jgi:hypothetical protein